MILLSVIVPFIVLTLIGIRIESTKWDAKTVSIAFLYGVWLLWCAYII
jgi:hypothetical protein